ncbi:transmembrane protein 198, partial [Homo sapiens]
MGPRFWGGPSPGSCAFPFLRPSPSSRTPRDWSASRCWTWSGAATAPTPFSPAQQPPSSHDGLSLDPSQLEPLAPRNPGPSGLCTASFTQKLRSPPAQLLPPEPDDAFWGAPCEQPLERRYQALPALVCIMCCLFGVVYCFFGYRCFKAVLFLTGLL